MTTDNEDNEDQGVPVAKVHITDKETGEELGVVNLTGVGPDTPEEQIKERAAKFFHRLKAAEDSLDPRRIKELSKLMPVDKLLDLAALELTKHVVSAYLEKIKTLETPQELEALAGVKGVTVQADKAGNVKVNVSGLDLETIQGNIKGLFKDFPDMSVEFMHFAWTHITAWAVSLMEEELGPEAITEQGLDDNLNDFIFDRNPEPFKDRLTLLANVWAEGVALTLVNALDPASRTLEELERFLGLRPEKAPPIEAWPLVQPSLFQGRDYEPYAVGPPTLVVMDYLLRPALGGTDEQGFFYKRKFRPGDMYLRLLEPREIAGAPDTKAIRTMRVFDCLTAYAARVNKPWEDPIIIDVEDIANTIGLEAMPRMDKIRIGVELMEEVSNHRILIPRWKQKDGYISVRLKPTIYVDDIEVRFPQPQLFNLGEDGISLIKRGDLKEAPQVIYTYRLGPWAEKFMNWQDLRQIGYLHRSALQENPYQHRMTSILKPYLNRMCGVQRKSLPLKRKVKGLLLYVCGTSEKLAAISADREKRNSWANQWDDTLLTLHDEGWRIEFDQATYPEDLRPPGFGGPDRRPRGYWSRLLEADIYIWPPEPIPSIGPLKKAATPKAKKGGLQGETVKRARGDKKLSQARLAEEVKVSQSLIAQIERGERNITPKLERRLRKALGL